MISASPRSSDYLYAHRNAERDDAYKDPVSPSIGLGEDIPPSLAHQQPVIVRLPCQFLTWGPAHVGKYAVMSSSLYDEGQLLMAHAIFSLQNPIQKTMSASRISTAVIFAARSGGRRSFSAR